MNNLGLTKAHVLTGIVCLCIGAIGTSVVMSHHFSQHNETKRQNQQQLTDDIKLLQSENSQLKSELEQAKSSQIEHITAQQKLEKSTLEKDKQQQKQSSDLKSKNDKLGEQVKQLQKQVTDQKAITTQLTEKNEQLQHRSDTQSALLLESKAHFEQQAILQRELRKLNKERIKLISTLNGLVEECRIFTEGKSWEAKSDSCDRKQKASDQLKQIDKTIDEKLSQIVVIDKTDKDAGLQKK
ncbi:MULTISPECIES: hypothetical protein [unclassified Vibrio]|uniref:hypothetical protein n=1 Tax=unclassified Vibrio TaxID=2614977 RepID=UPI0009EF1D36|nr:MULTISPECIES: hypothetical protein [unclassified Vibrio]